MKPDCFNWGKIGAGGLISILALALLTAIAGWIDRQELPAPAITAAESVVLPDGSELELLGVGLGERTGEDHPSNKTIFSFFRKISKGGGTYMTGDDERGLQIASETEDGRLVRWRAFSKYPSTMLMEIRLKDRSGASRKFPTHLKGATVWRDSRLDKTASFGSTEFMPKSQSVIDLADAMNHTNLELLVEHRDPDSGWIHLSGPYLLHEALPDRYVFVLPAWRRDLPTMEFRAILADGSMKDFSIPNPDFKAAPAAMTTTPLPLTHTGDDYSLTVKQVKRILNPGDHPVSELEMDLKPHPVSATDPNPRPLGHAYELSAEDEWGNVVSYRNHCGAALPAFSKRMKINLRIERGLDYPQHLRAGFPVLEGVVRPDGKHVDFTLLPDAQRLGIRTAPVGTIARVKDYDHRGRETKQGALELRFAIKGELSTEDFNLAEQRLGYFMHWEYLIFPEGSDYSVENNTGRGGGGGGGSGGRSDFEKDVRFRDPSEVLLPGARFKVGVHRRLPPDEVPLVLDLPAEIGSK